MMLGNSQTLNKTLKTLNFNDVNTRMDVSHRTLIPRTCNL
jgi:hypothetical protein